MVEQCGGNSHLPSCSVVDLEVSVLRGRELLAPLKVLMCSDRGSGEGKALQAHQHQFFARRLVSGDTESSPLDNFFNAGSGCLHQSPLRGPCLTFINVFTLSFA